MHTQRDTIFDLILEDNSDSDSLYDCDQFSNKIDTTHFSDDDKDETDNSKIPSRKKMNVWGCSECSAIFLKQKYFFNHMSKVKHCSSNEGKQKPMKGHVGIFKGNKYTKQ